MRALSVTAIGVALAAVAVGTQEPVSISILRQDGYLVPVAKVEGNRYRPLTEASHHLENTNVFTAAAVALGRTTWMVARQSGEQMQVASLNRAMVSDHCSTQEAWRTSFKGIPVPKMSADVDKIGIAVIGASASQPENVTSLPDEASRSIAGMAMKTAAAAEAKRLAKQPDLLWEYSPGPIQAATLVVRKLFRHTTGNLATYFFETAKDPLPLITSGWVVDSPAGPKMYNVHFAVNDDSYKEGKDGSVIGLVPLGDRALWVMRWHGYAGESYAIHEWPSGRIRFESPGVGC